MLEAGIFAFWVVVWVRDSIYAVRDAEQGGAGRSGVERCEAVEECSLSSALVSVSGLWVDGCWGSMYIHAAKRHDCRQCTRNFPLRCTCSARV